MNPDVTQNVETPDDNIRKSPENRDDHQNPTEKDVEPPVIVVDEEYFDNDLIANINPSIARRLMNRKGKQDAVKSLSKEKTADVVHKKTRSENKTGVETMKAGLSKEKGNVKTRVPAGSLSKPVRQPIAKKRKEPEPSESDEESEFEFDVEDIPLKRKLSSSKMPKVPEVATDNISFHHPENANKWKCVCLKRIALER